MTDTTCSIIPGPDPAGVSVALEIYIFFPVEFEVFLCCQAGHGNMRHVGITGDGNVRVCVWHTEPRATVSLYELCRAEAIGRVGYTAAGYGWLRPRIIYSTARAQRIQGCNSLTPLCFWLL